MDRFFKAALCVATSLACAPIANAAVYAQYTIYASGSGNIYYPPSGNMATPPTQISGLLLFYNVRLGNVSTIPDGQSRSSFNDTGYFSTSGAKITSTGFSLTGRGQPGSPSTGTFSVSACGSFDPFFAGSIALDPTCSTATYDSSFGSNRLFFSGTVQSLSATRIESDQSIEGLQRVIPGVPEPSTWALMLAGFGLTGYAMRRRRVAFA